MGLFTSQGEEVNNLKNLFLRTNKLLEQGIFMGGIFWIVASVII